MQKLMLLLCMMLVSGSALAQTYDGEDTGITSDGSGDFGSPDTFSFSAKVYACKAVCEGLTTSTSIKICHSVCDNVEWATRNNPGLFCEYLKGQITASGHSRAYQILAETVWLAIC